MQQSQRAQRNPALERAVAEADARGLPVVVGFGLTDGYPEANLRHYRFMLEGLSETASTLSDRGIPLVLRLGSPADVALDLSRDAALVVCDRGYLPHQRAWRREVAAGADCPVIEVDADTVVPVEIASQKQEYAARTFRPRVTRHLGDFLVPSPDRAPSRSGLSLDLPGEDLSDPHALCDTLDVDRTVGPGRFTGGTSEAARHLDRFLGEGLDGYASGRRDPTHELVSHQSAYLHFGQVSPVAVALAALEAGAPSEDVDAFMDELVVRRELAVNFCWYSPAHDRYAGLPDWARRTLADHRDDPREHVYTTAQLDRGETHDPYWNAAMREMRETGYLHNHLRMYWGKQILAWTNTPEHAYRTALALNNRYFLDGRDPSSFANVGWLFGLHDRAWPERAVFGKVRTMTRGGLERKIDAKGYVAWVEARLGA